MSLAGQVRGGAGPGCLATVATAGGCLAVAGLSARRAAGLGTVDRAVLVGAVLACLAWAVTGRPVVGVVAANAVDAAAFVPTLRSARSRPWDEGLSVYAVSAVKFALSLAALRSLSTVTVLYPGLALAEELVTVGVLVGRRRALGAALAATRRGARGRRRPERPGHDGRSSAGPAS